MDSMDWFSPSSTEAPVQIRALNNVLAIHGRVFLRSAGLSPWYIKLFENLGFSAKRVGARLPGTCIDRFVLSENPWQTNANFLRVNMYASTWIMTKQEELPTNDAPELTI
jgi:betaine lipid synthase